MNNLTTRKIVLGMLMVLVLAFGVQGIVEATDLPLTIVSGDRQTKPEGNTFDITFGVGERSNTTAIRNDQNQLITSESSPVLINSSGFVVDQAPNGTYYRTISTVLGISGSTLYRAEVASDNAAADGDEYTAVDRADAFLDGGFRYWKCD